ncbi:MAG: copper chaperone PCu(A)C [Pseudomonadota bacterium]
MKKLLFAILASLLFTSAALAQIKVTAPWIRATVPQQTSTGVFLQLQAAKAARLVEVRSPGAVGAIHQMEMSGQVMKMREIDGVDLAAGRPVSFSSGGLHIMLSELKRPYREGDIVPVTLVVLAADGKRHEIMLQVPVKPLNYVAPR